MNIREVQRDDFESILPLFYQLWPNRMIDENKLKTVFINSLHAQQDIMLVVEIEGRIVAVTTMVIMNSFWQESKIGYISTLVVDEQFRNKGIGQRLIEELTTIAINDDCKKIELDSSFTRLQAHLFYEKIGFNKRAYLFSKDLN